MKAKYIKPKRMRK